MTNTDKLAEFEKLLKDVFREGFYSPRTYNDTVLNSADEAWEEAKASLLRAASKAIEALAAHEAAARATAPATGDTNGRHDGLRPDLHGRVPLGGHTPGALADLLWASDDVMALNAELGLTMDRLVQFAQAVLAAEKAQPAGEAVPADHFAGVRKMIAPLREVGLTRDTAGMCVVTLNGFPVIQDNGDVISHFASPDWLSGYKVATPPAAPAAEPLTNEQRLAITEAERNVAADCYFHARAWILDTNQNRRLFEAGFDAGIGASGGEVRK